MSSFEWPPEGGSRVTTINGLSGAITLAAGSNITLTPSGNMITIAATGGGGGSGVDTIGTIDSQVASANGADITGTSLVLQSASVTVPGLVNLTTQTFAGVKTFANIIDSGLTASTALVANASKQLTSSVTTSAELAFVSGVTSAIQTQINSKQATLTIGDLTDAGTDGIVVTGGTGSVIGAGTSLAQHVADASHNGYLSSTDWSTFNNKQSMITSGNLTDAGTDGIVVTGGTGAVLGSGTSIAQHVSDATHNGYLNSTDWSTFNAKQAAGSYITALTGDVTASGPGSVAATLAATSNATLTNLSALTSAVNLVSIGAITSGTWNATTIALNKGGTGQTTKAAAFDALSPMTTGGDIIYGGASGTGTRLANGSAGQVLTSNGTTVAPSWQGAAAPTAVAFTATSSTTSISNGSTTTLVNPTVDLDTNSAYNNSTGAFTAPSAGVYIFQGAFTSNAAITTVVNDAAIFVFNKNSGSATYNVRSVQQAAGLSRIALNASSPPISLATNDTVVLQLNNATGSTLTGIGSTESFFGGFKIGN